MEAGVNCSAAVRAPSLVTLWTRERRRRGLGVMCSMASCSAKHYAFPHRGMRPFVLRLFIPLVREQYAPNCRKICLEVASAKFFSTPITGYLQGLAIGWATGWVNTAGRAGRGGKQQQERQSRNLGAHLFAKPCIRNKNKVPNCN